MKKILKLIVGLLFIVLISGCEKNQKNEYSIVSTIFPGYDVSRAITNNSDFSIEMLLKPGSEIHDFEPTPQDIIKIKNSSIFIYVGGESDEWVEKVLVEIDESKTKVIKLIDLVDTYDEEIVEGMEADEDDIESTNEETEIDEHVWTTPVNVIKIVSALKNEIIKIDAENKELYEKNASNYIRELEALDQEIKEVVTNAKRHELIFGDRFPFRYFTELYGLTYYAAFPGCSEASEASAKTIAFLIDKVKRDNIPVVFHIELSSGKIADAISKETKAKVLELHSAHNISKNDFDAGLTYVDLMKKNIEALREALN